MTARDHGHFLPYYKKLKAKEKKDGGSGFAAIEEQQREMNKLSVILARANAHIQASPTKM